MATKQELEERLEALEEAIDTGALHVVYGNKTVIYRSMKEMLTARNILRERLGLNDGGNGGRVYPRHNRGFGKCS